MFYIIFSLSVPYLHLVNKCLLSIFIAVDSLKPCPDREDCVKDSIQASLPGFVRGVPELGIDSLDPFLISNLTLLLPGGLKVHYIQGIAKGAKKCLVDTAR